ncbi:MAG: hypothetical protein JSU82_01040 [Rhodospirillales bacterium]|nr:MAG: hypothetical protein JSU82_01040 [Rhodospirillales bacterium]
MLLLILALGGCLQMERVVQVNGDGSGVIIERMILSKEIVSMMQEMQSTGQPMNIRDDEKLRTNAANFGTAVRFVSSRDLVTDFGRGYEARYAFDDITRLRVGQNIDEGMPGDGAGGGFSTTDDQSYTTFTFRRTNPAQLVIHWPVQEGEHAAGSDDSFGEFSEAGGDPEQEQMAMEMMSMAFRDMRVAMHVEVLGDIVETNALHVEGRRVTLVDIDFGALLSSEAALRAMAEAKPESVADMKELMKLVPGIKLEVEPEVAIRFR